MSQKMVTRPIVFQGIRKWHEINLSIFAVLRRDTESVKLYRFTCKLLAFSQQLDTRSKLPCKHLLVSSQQ